MTTIVMVKDESARGEKINSLRLTLASEKVTLEELIKRRVQQEVQKFNLQRPVCFKALVKPKGAEETSGGYRMKTHRDLDADEQVKHALEGFKSKNFFVTLNGKQIQNLSDEIVITDTSEVSFVCFMPVVGG